MLQEPGQKIIDVDTAAQMLQLVLPQVRAWGEGCCGVKQHWKQHANVLLKG